MKKISILFFSLFLVLAFSGCTEEKSTESNGQTKLSDNGTEQTGNQNELPKEETIQEILQKGKNIESVEYDLVMYMNGNEVPTSTKVYDKGTKYRTEIDFPTGKQITIFDGQNSYKYNSDSDTYQKLSTAGEGAILFDDALGQALNDSSINEIGKETINGTETRVLEFNFSNTNVKEGKTKLWVSEETGIPIKIEFETSSGTFTMEFKNHKLNNVSDALFEVPEEKIINP